MSYYRPPYGRIAGAGFDHRAELRELLAAPRDAWNEPGGRGARLRSRLFEVLFPSDAWQAVGRNALGRAEAPAAYPVRVRVWASAPEIASLPWLLSTWCEQKLVRSGWTFEVVADERPPRATAQLAAPCRVLALAAEARRDQPAGLDPEILRQALGNMSAARATADYFQVATSKTDVDRALATFGPQLLYYFGPAEPAAPADLRLSLADGSSLRLSELAGIIEKAGRVPEVVYIAGLCPDNARARAVLSAAPLGRAVPALILATFDVDAKEAEACTHRWLRRCLHDGLDPVVALCALDEQGAASSALTNYDQWAGRPEPGRTWPRRDALDLDREDQRALVDRHVRELVRSRRVDAMVACADSHNLLELFPSQALSYLDDTRVVHANRLKLVFPPPPAPSPATWSNLASLLEDELRVRLGISRSDSLRVALRNAAPPHRGRMPLLWLLWETNDKHCGRVGKAALGQWLDFSAHLVAYCDDSLRIVSYLGLEVEAAKHELLEQTVEELSIPLFAGNPLFRCSFLPPLGRVSRQI